MRAVCASAGILAIIVGIFIGVHRVPYATASDAGPLAANVVRSAIDTNWHQMPGSSLITSGKKLVTLNPCPLGVVAAEPWYYVYLSGTGTPEAVLVTGGTCKGDGHPGSMSSPPRIPIPRDM